MSEPIDDGDPDVARAKRRAAALVRRAERKAARRAAPPPERNTLFDAFSLADLRVARAVLIAEAERASYWRRIIQGRLDSVRAPTTKSRSAFNLSRVLSDAHQSPQRMAHIPGGPPDSTPPLPHLDELWARQSDPTDPVHQATLDADLSQAEQALSAYRQDLYHRTDLITTELIVRYRDAPQLALLILPRR